MLCDDLWITNKLITESHVDAARSDTLRNVITSDIASSCAESDIVYLILVLILILFCQTCWDRFLHPAPNWLLLIWLHFCDMLPFLIVVVCKWFMEELCAVLLDVFLSCVETQTLLPCMSWSYICHCCSLQFMNMLWVCPMHIFCEVSLLSDWTSCSSVMQKFDSRRNSKQSEVWTCHSWFVFSWAVPL